MADWFNSLTLLQQIYLIIAAPSTIILLLQTIFLLAGVGGGDADADAGDMPETDAGGGDGLALFSIRGIMAFLCVGGWSGMAIAGSGMPAAGAVILSAACGFLALLSMAYLMKLALKLQSSGNIDIKNAIGKIGEVYIPIPASKGGSGKINIIVQETYMEVSAATREPTTIKTREMVRVTDTEGAGLVIVERLTDKDKA